MSNDATTLDPDAVDEAGNDLFESGRGVRFLAAPESRFAHQPPPTPEEIAEWPRVRRHPAKRAFTLRSIHSQRLYAGRLPPQEPDGPPRIPGIDYCHFVLRGLAQRRAEHLNRYLDNLDRHVNALHNALYGWSRRNHRWIQTFLPVGTRPLYDQTAWPHYVLHTQFPGLMKLATAIAAYDRVLLEAGASVQVARDMRLHNPHLADYKPFFARIRAVLYAIHNTRKLGLPRPADAPAHYRLDNYGDLPQAKPDPADPGTNPGPPPGDEAPASREHATGGPDPHPPPGDVAPPTGP